MSTIDVYKQSNDNPFIFLVLSILPNSGQFYKKFYSNKTFLTKLSKTLLILETQLVILTQKSLCIRYKDFLSFRV